MIILIQKTFRGKRWCRKKKNEVNRYFGYGCEDPNDYKLDIFGLVKMKYNVKNFIYSALQLKSNIYIYKRL